MYFNDSEPRVSCAGVVTHDAAEDQQGVLRRGGAPWGTWCGWRAASVVTGTAGDEPTRIEGWSVNHKRVERLWRQEDSRDAFPDSSHDRVFGWNRSIVDGRIPLDRSFRSTGSDRHAGTDPPTERCRYTGEQKR